MDTPDLSISNGAQNQAESLPAEVTVNQDENSSVTSSSTETENSAKRRTRVVRPYPNQPFEESLGLALAIQQHASGKPVRRVTLFDALNKSPESSQSRQLVACASGYGLVKGASNAEYLELTDAGKVASGDEYSEHERTQIRATLAILHIPTFKKFYDELAGAKFPARQVLVDLAKTIVAENLALEALDLFIVNAKFVGLLRVVAGVERLLTLDHLLELTTSNPSTETQQLEADPSNDEYESEDTTSITPAKVATVKTTLDEVCFYISPIGETGSEQRQHADLFLNYIIQPALEGTGLKVVRADKIDRGGVITSQIIRHLLQSRLVIADLSFHNPNVFYELAIRHASRLPTVHIMRAIDSIPFDLNQMRIIKIDSSSIYTLVPQLDTYQAEISTQVRRALDGEENFDNPISVFYPSFKIRTD